MRRALVWTVAVVAGLAVLAVIASFFIDEPLRRSMERDVNRRLKGYTARIDKLDFHPIGFSLDLEGVTLIQDANPDPPVARFPRISASVQWRALLRGRVVANFDFVRPRLYVNRQHLVKEAADPVPVEQRGWQEALTAIYPLKINEFKITGGEVTYVDTEGDRSLGRPLELKQINVRADNIRNIISPRRVYPSPVRADLVIFDRGRLTIDGEADFLAVPYPGINAAFRLEQVELGNFEPVLRRYNVLLRKGVLAGQGRIEYAPQVQEVHLAEVRLEGFDGDFVHTAATAGKEARAASAAGETAAEVSNHPTALVKVDRVIIRDGTFGFISKGGKQDYRLFLTGADIDVSNLSNQQNEGTSTAKLTGKFMGSGDTRVDAAFRPEVRGPDFDVRVQIEHTDMRALNDILRAYGRFDVTAGDFSLYSEIAVKDRRVRGYVKPLFRDLNVYDPTQDRDKPALRKLYERVVEGASKILKNRRREQVATVVDVSGPLENPKASTWQTIANLLQNAFVKAILPGFDREAGSRR